jgi:hypothetical protein
LPTSAVDNHVDKLYEPSLSRPPQMTFIFRSSFARNEFIIKSMA